MCSDAALTLHDVAKYYEIYQKPRHRLWQMLWRGRRSFCRQFWALADITLEVRKGECLGIVGRNGAGKSTLLQLIAGTLTPSRGQIQVNGRLAALLELGSGFNPDFSGRDNIYLNASILGLTKAETDAAYPKILEFADIGDFIDLPVKTYSSGMALRLAFAVMANIDADILVIDEALAVGDAFFTQKCLRFLREFMQKHTVIFVSHDMNAITSLCSRAVLLDSGRISFTGSAREVAQKYLEEMYADQQDDMQPGKVEFHAPKLREKDMRAELFASAPLRNDMRVFNSASFLEGFGTGKATVEQVELVDDEGNAYAWVVGGEKARLCVVCHVNAAIGSPIVGFLVRDRHGQEIFGDNTWLVYGKKYGSLQAGDTLVTTFEFIMPILAPGEYYITAAIAEGTPEEHIQHHWRHEALAFTVQAESVAGGIVGVPMLDMEMRKVSSRK